MQRAWPSQSGKLAAAGLHLEELPESVIPDGWVELRPRMCGICGSDVSLLKGQSSPYLSPLTSFPAVLGHEILADVSAGGTRVVIDPSLGCAARRLPPCQMCAVGRPDDCLRRGDPGLGAGLMLGYHARFPGGWSDRMWAPEEQLVPVPEDMPDERAVLTEPAAIVLTGLRKLNWGAARNVLVIGSGPLGLLSVALISELYPAATVFAVARYPQQAAMAERMGASHVVRDPRNDRAFLAVTGDPLATMTGFPPHFPRGFDVVVVAAGSASALAQATRWTEAGGQILLLGGVAEASIDWTPVWSRHISVIGSYGYGESGVDTFRAILSLFSVMSQPLEDLVTHRFPLPDYRQAVAAVTSRQGIIKAVFTRSADDTPRADP